MNVGMPSDLQNITCDSMERDYLSSYDRDRLLRETIMKEERMDFEDDSSRPFGRYKSASIIYSFDDI